MKVLVTQSCLFSTRESAALQAPLFMEFPSPGDLPNPGIKLGSPALQADSLPSEPPGKPIYIYIYIYIFFFSSVGEHLDCFHVLANINSTETNMGMPL